MARKRKCKSFSIARRPIIDVLRLANKFNEVMCRMNKPGVRFEQGIRGSALMIDQVSSANLF